jgi:hypothetical protein
MFVQIARYENELAVNSAMKQILTGPDTLSEYRSLAALVTALTVVNGDGAGEVDFDGAVAAYNTANTTTYTLADLTLVDSNIPISDVSLGNSGTGEIANIANIIPRENILNSAEVFDIGNIVAGEFNGPEIGIARNRLGRLQAQFTDDDIRMVAVNVEVAQVSPSAIGFDV